MFAWAGLHCGGGRAANESESTWPGFWNEKNCILLHLGQILNKLAREKTNIK